MKTVYTLLAIFGIALSPLFSQNNLINVNPDPNGEPWYAGGLRPLTEADWNYLNSLPKLTVTESTKDLPVSVDNSTQPYFRPIFNQDGGSCGQASGIGYCFTYEIDCERGIPANISSNQYPTHFTWNFLNGGNGGGSWYFDGWKIIQADGCPNIADYGGSISYGGDTRWMSGYDEYYNGMHNKVYEIYSINVTTPEGIDALKNWMYDHMNGSPVGGIACFGAGVSGTFSMTTLPAGTPEAGKAIVTRWDPSVNHAMTFVGYNDDIRYDVNNDGQYTNNIDITGDGIVDVRDWEIGGVKLANSWGNSFGNNGYAYTLYRNLAESLANGGIWANTVHIINTKETYSPVLTMKATVKHDSRNKVKIIAGVSNDLASDHPENFLSFPCFNFQGGDLYMQGGYTNSDKTIEIGLDVTPLLSYVIPGQPAKFFLEVVEKDPYSQGSGQIISCSLMDYSNGVDEVVCDQQNVNIIDNDTTSVSITKTLDFDKVQIASEELPAANVNEPYNYQLEAENGNPPYTWGIKIDYDEEELSTTIPQITDEQLIPSDNDDGFALKLLDFAFPFYGQEYNQITVLTDGAIVFKDNFEYIRDEESIIANKCLAAYCADLMIYPAQGDGIWYSGDENGAIIRWKTSLFDQPNVDVESAIKLYPNGQIDFYYGNGITEGLAWAAGISNGDGSSYSIAQISNSYFIPDNYSTKFMYADFPLGMQIATDGMFYGTPVVPNTTWNVTFQATDYSGIFATKTLAFTTLMTGQQEYAGNRLTQLQGFPNPFAKEISIKFYLPAQEKVSLSVYKTDGTLVMSVIYNKEYNAGMNEINITDKRLPAGIYFCELKTGQGLSSIKIVKTN